MKYYPLNRVKTGLITNGSEFRLPNGSLYRGPYYQTYDGKFFTGNSPIEGPSETLTPTSPITTEAASQAELRLRYGILGEFTPNTFADKGSYREPVPHYPVPTEIDYKRGAFTRYFAKKRNRAGFVIEVDKVTFDSLQSADSVYDYVSYEATSLFWQITGPFYDDRTNRQYKVAGIVDTNKRLVEAKEKSFVGLKAFIGDEYSKFAKPVGK